MNSAKVRGLALLRNMQRMNSARWFTRTEASDEGANLRMEEEGGQVPGQKKVHYDPKQQANLHPSQGTGSTFQSDLFKQGQQSNSSQTPSGQKPSDFGMTQAGVANNKSSQTSGQKFQTDPQLPQANPTPNGPQATNPNQQSDQKYPDQKGSQASNPSQSGKKFPDTKAASQPNPGQSPGQKYSFPSDQSAKGNLFNPETNREKKEASDWKEKATSFTERAMDAAQDVVAGASEKARHGWEVVKDKTAELTGQKSSRTA